MKKVTILLISNFLLFFAFFSRSIPVFAATASQVTEHGQFASLYAEVGTVAKRGSVAVTATTPTGYDLSKVSKITTHLSYRDGWSGGLTFYDKDGNVIPFSFTAIDGYNSYVSLDNYQTYDLSNVTIKLSGNLINTSYDEDRKEYVTYTFDATIRETVLGNANMPSANSFADTKIPGGTERIYVHLYHNNGAKYHSVQACAQLLSSGENCVYDISKRLYGETASGYITEYEEYINLNDYPTATTIRLYSFVANYGSDGTVTSSATATFYGNPGPVFDGNLTNLTYLDGDRADLVVTPTFPDETDTSNRIIWQKFTGSSLSDVYGAAVTQELMTTTVDYLSYNSNYVWSEDTNWTTLSTGDKYSIYEGRLAFRVTEANDDETYYRCIAANSAGHAISDICYLRVLPASFKEIQTYSMRGDEINIGNTFGNNDIMTMIRYNNNTASVKLCMPGVVFIDGFGEIPDSVLGETITLMYRDDANAENGYISEITGVYSKDGDNNPVIGNTDVSTYEKLAVYSTSKTIKQGPNNFTTGLFKKNTTTGFSTVTTGNTLEIGDWVFFVKNDNSVAYGLVEAVNVTDTTVNSYKVGGTTVNAADIASCTFCKYCELPIEGVDKQAPEIIARNHSECYSKLVKEGTDNTPATGNAETDNVPLLVENRDEYTTNYATNKANHDYLLKIYANDNISGQNVTVNWYGPFATKPAEGQSLGTAIKNGLELRLFGTNKEENNGFYVVTATDEAGNTSFTTINLQIYDMTAPVINALVLDPSVETYALYKTLTIEATDNYLLADKPYAFSQTKAIPDPTSLEWQTSNTKVIAEPGTWYAFARDIFGNVTASYEDKYAGNEDIFTDPITNLDNRAPTIDKIIIGGDTFDENGNIDTFYINVKATDDQSELLYYEVAKQDGSSMDDIGTTVLRGRFDNGTNFEVTGLSTNGTYVISVSDAAGNTSSTTEEIMLAGETGGDDILRMLGITFERNPITWTNRDVSLKLKVSDESNLARGECFRLYLNDTPYSEWVEYTGNNSFTLTTNGSYYLHVKDYTGKEHVSNVISVNNIDKHVPSLTVTKTSGDKLTINMSDMITAGSEDEGKGYKESGLSRLTVEVNGGPVEYLAVYDTDTATSTSATSSVSYTMDIETAGDYAFKLYDNAGNVATVGEGGTIHIDPKDLTPDNPLFEGTAEEIAARIRSYITFTPTGWTNGTVLITFNPPSTEGFAAAPYSWDNNPFSGNNYYKVDENGIYSFRIKSRYGVIYESEPIDVSTIDADAPTIKATQSGETVSIDVTDEASGLARLTQTFNGTTTELKAYDGENNSSYNAEAKESGIYTFTVYDRAGNTSSDTVVITASSNNNPNPGPGGGGGGTTIREYYYYPSDPIYVDQIQYVPYEVDGGGNSGGGGYYVQPSTPSIPTNPTRTPSTTPTKVPTVTPSAKTPSRVITTVPTSKITNPTHTPDLKDKDLIVTKVPAKTTPVVDKTETDSSEFQAKSTEKTPEKSAFNWLWIIIILCALVLLVVGFVILYPMIKNKMIDKKYGNVDDSSDSDSDDDDEDNDEEDDDNDDSDEDDDEDDDDLV